MFGGNLYLNRHQPFLRPIGQTFWLYLSLHLITLKARMLAIVQMVAKDSRSARVCVCAGAAVHIDKLIVPATVFGTKYIGTDGDNLAVNALLIIGSNDRR